MKVEFTKMHGLGNDFVIIDNMLEQIKLEPELIRFLADRHTGIGCDQVVVLKKSTNELVDFMFRFYNSDGSIAGQCGNGVRCMGKYLIEKGKTDKKVITAETVNNIVTIHIDGLDAIRVNMGSPKFEPEDIPLLYDERRSQYDIELSNEVIKVSSLSMGNPHAVIFVDDIETARVEDLGHQFQKNPKYPDSVNVGFVQILDRKHIKVRVYERGAGETLACGTGACAAVVAGIMDNRLDNEIVVGVKRGNLVINWNGEGSEVWMAGPATTVYDGSINI